MIKVHMLTAGPNGNYRPGDIVAVDYKRARILVEGKHAEYVRSAAVRMPPNTAMMSTPGLKQVG